MGMPNDYVDVAERIREFREKYPDGTLQQVSCEFVQAGTEWGVLFTAAAYRNQEDARPAHGTAWEPFPGKTNFTRGSEVQNAETSAWGRAIIAAGAADAKRVASANEVANRQADAQALDAAFASATAGKPSPPAPNKQLAAISEAFDGSIEPAGEAVDYTFKFGKYNGKHISEADDSYLKYLLRQPAKPGFEKKQAEQHAIFRAELQRRGVAA